MVSPNAPRQSFSGGSAPEAVGCGHQNQTAAITRVGCQAVAADRACDLDCPLTGLGPSEPARPQRKAPGIEQVAIGGIGRLGAGLVGQQAPVQQAIGPFRQVGIRPRADQIERRKIVVEGGQNQTVPLPLGMGGPALQVIDDAPVGHQEGRLPFLPSPLHRCLQVHDVAAVRGRQGKTRRDKRHSKTCQERPSFQGIVRILLATAKVSRSDGIADFHRSAQNRFR